MIVLHIEHAITDFEHWGAAFAALAERRRQGGVQAERISRPIDDPRYVLIDLDFDSIEQANRFLDFLTNQVWPTPDKSPALRGRPITRVLELTDAAAAQ